MQSGPHSARPSSHVRGNVVYCLQSLGGKTMTTTSTTLLKAIAILGNPPQMKND